MLNRYYGWYVDTGDLDAAERAWEDELRAWAATASRSSSPSTAPTPTPACTLPPTPWTEEYQVAYLDMNHRVFDRIDAVVGEQVWNFADFATTSGSCGSAATRRACSPATANRLEQRRPDAAGMLLPCRFDSPKRAS